MTSWCLKEEISKCHTNLKKNDVWHLKVIHIKEKLVSVKNVRINCENTNLF